MIANLKTIGSTLSLPSASSPLRQQSQAITGLHHRHGAAMPFAQRLHSKRPLPEWKAVQVLPPLRSSTAPQIRSIWIAPQHETFGEKLVFAVLTATAVATVLYGFSSVLDLLQNWAAFQTGFTRFLF